MDLNQSSTIPALRLMVLSPGISPNWSVVCYCVFPTRLRVGGRELPAISELRLPDRVRLPLAVEPLPLAVEPLPLAAAAQPRILLRQAVDMDGPIGHPAP